MAIQIRIQDSIIRVSLFQCPAFTEYVALLRSLARWDSKTSTWIVSPARIADLRAALYDLDLDTVIESEETKAKIEAIRKPEIINTLDRVPFELTDLKVQPWKGKHPNELFQFEDLVRCVNHTCWALFNEQGTGKSWVLISALDILRQKKDLKKVLFVTSDSGVINIKREFTKFSNFDPDRIAVGGVRNRRPFTEDVDVVICNYRSFLLISDEYQKSKDKGKKKTKKYRSTPIPLEEWIGDSYSAVVLDESHKIANPSARQTHALHLVREYFDRAYLATGTPSDVESKYYSQLTFLHPSFTHNYSYNDWLAEYANIGNRFSAYAINYFKKEKKPELTRIVSSISSKRLADECIELPEHLEHTIYVELNDIQRKIYEDLIKEELKSIQKAGALDFNTIQSLFPYFISAIDNPLMLLDSERAPESTKALAKKFTFDKHSKLEALDELLEKHASSSKIIIWTAHPSCGRALSEYLKKYKTIVINGQTKPKGCKDLDEYKNSVIEEFTKGDAQILIAGIQVLNSSVTIVEANVQIYFDNTWSYVDANQSLCRIHRIGQEKTVFTYYLVATRTLDELRSASLQNKDFINRRFGSKEYLDQKDLREIFSSER